MMCKLVVNGSSTSSILARLTEIESACISASIDGMQQVLDTVDVNAAINCPVETGSLAASQFSDADIEGTMVVGTVGYGGLYAIENPKTGKSTDDYAVEVHEGWVRNPAQAKWLEKTMNDEAPEMLYQLGEYLAPILGGG